MNLFETHLGTNPQMRQENCQLQHSQECQACQNAWQLIPQLFLHLPACEHHPQIQQPAKLTAEGTQLWELLFLLKSQIVLLNQRNWDQYFKMGQPNLVEEVEHQVNPQQVYSSFKFNYPRSRCNQSKPNNPTNLMGWCRPSILSL